MQEKGGRVGDKIAQLQTLDAGYELYCPTPTLAFLLTADRTIVITSYTTYMVKYDHKNYRFQLERFREKVRSGEMKTIIDVVVFCNLRPGNYNFMDGLELIPTILRRHL